MEQEEPSSIIIRMPNWLGDLVMATPVLSAVREKWPKAHIVAMTSAGLAPLLEKDPRINEVLSFNKPQGFIHRLHPYPLIDKLREGRYDLGILLTNSFSSAWWFYLAGIKERLGFGRPFLLTKSATFPKNYKKQHLVHSYLQLLEKIGIPFQERKPEIFLTREEKAEAEEKIRALGAGGGRIVIGLNPGAAYGPAKCWPPERYRALIRKLLEDERFLILVFGDAASLSLIETIAGGLSERVINLAGKTSLRELLSLIGACDLFITNDSGPMHVAAALQIPLIALFGSTSDVMTGPYGGGEVIHKRASCSPCYLRTCPLDFRCMKEIEVQEVLSKILRMLRTLHV